MFVAKEGGILVKQSKSIVNIGTHNEYPGTPGWKRKINKIHVKGAPFAEAVVKMRQEERK